MEEGDKQNFVANQRGIQKVLLQLSEAGAEKVGHNGQDGLLQESDGHQHFCAPKFGAWPKVVQIRLQAVLNSDHIRNGSR